MTDKCDQKDTHRQPNRQQEDPNIWKEYPSEERTTKEGKHRDEGACVYDA